MSWKKINGDGLFSESNEDWILSFGGKEQMKGNKRREMLCLY